MCTILKRMITSGKQLIRMRLIRSGLMAALALMVTTLPILATLPILGSVSAFGQSPSPTTPAAPSSAAVPSTLPVDEKAAAQIREFGTNLKRDIANAKEGSSPGVAPIKGRPLTKASIPNDSTDGGSLITKESIERSSVLHDLPDIDSAMSQSIIEERRKEQLPMRLLVMQKLTNRSVTREALPQQIVAIVRGDAKSPGVPLPTDKQILRIMTAHTIEQSKNIPPPEIDPEQLRKAETERRKKQTLAQFGECKSASTQKFPPSWEPETGKSYPMAHDILFAVQKDIPTDADEVFGDQTKIITAEPSAANDPTNPFSLGLATGLIQCLPTRIRVFSGVTVVYQGDYALKHYTADPAAVGVLDQRVLVKRGGSR